MTCPCNVNPLISDFYIAYRMTMIQRPSVVRQSTISKIFFSETNQSQILYESSIGGGTNVYINNPGHITKMAAMPIIYGKNL